MRFTRASGGVIDLTSKGGTNDLHGSAWEFNRLSAYTANTFDNNAHDAPKGVYTRNQFGYTIGGPVIKNKLFFFQSTEWLRVRSGAVLLNYIPTSQLIAASASNTQAYMTAYGGGAPTSFQSTLTKAQVLAITGDATGTFAASSLAANTPVLGLVSYIAPSDAGGDNPQNTYDLLGRVDYNFTPNTTVFFRYGRESLVELPGSVFNSPFPQYNVGETIKVNNYLASLSHTLYAVAAELQSKVSFFRDVEVDQFNTALANTPTLFFYNGATVQGTQISLPGFYNVNTGTGGLPYGGPQNSLQLEEDMVWSKGKHTIRYGGQFNYTQMNKAYGAYAQAVEQIGSNLGNGLDGFIGSVQPDATIKGTLTNFTGAVSPQGKVPCSATGYFASGRARRPQSNARLHGDAAGRAAVIRKKRPVQGLGYLSGGQLPSHTQTDAQLWSALRALRRATQQQSSTRFEPVLRPGIEYFPAGADCNDSIGEEQPNRTALGPSLGHGCSAHRFRL